MKNARLFENEHIETLGNDIGVIVSEAHTFGTDAMLLAYFANARRNDLACDLGTGCGIIPLLWKRDGNCQKIYGVEIQEKGYSQFSRSVEADDISNSVFPIHSDLKQLKGKLPQGAFDLASKLILIYCCWLPFRNIPYTLIVGTFRAGGDTKIGILYDCLSLYLIGVPVVCFLGLVAKVDFVYLIIAMYMCEDIPKIILSLIRFKSKKWIRNLTDR